MTKYLIFFFFFFLVNNFKSFSQDCCEQKIALNTKALLTNLKNLSSDAFEGRRTGTKGAKKARKYIINEFLKQDVKPLGKQFEQSFLFQQHRKEYNGSNILGFIKGSSEKEKFIVISAHYDHEGIKFGKIYNGADDNASGLAALFAFAEYFKMHPPQHSVILAAFDGEELGLEGSKYFVNNTIIPLKDIVLNLNMDMISRSNKNELFVVGTSENKRLKYLVANAKSSCKIKLVKGHDGYDGLDNWTYSSDHANFYKKDIPFIYFGVEDHEDYHEPTDDYENINPKFYAEAVSTIISVFKKIDTSSF